MRKAVYCRIMLLIIAPVLFACNKDRNDEESKQPPPASPAPRKISIDVFVNDLSYPWGLGFLPNGDLLFTERGGRLYILKKGSTSPTLLATRQVQQNGEGGLLGIAIDPAFATNQYVYSYETAGDNRVVRYKLTGEALLEDKIILQGIEKNGNHNGGVVLFGPDGYLYIGTGDAQNPSLAQDLSSLNGKILRIDRDGNAAPGNPFNSLIWSFGHRNVQGLAWNENGTMYATEHGPSGEFGWCCHDELNRIEKGKNYGWPLAIAGTETDTLVAPLAHSGNDTWAPSGGLYTGSTGIWPGYMISACLRGQKLARFKMNSDGSAVVGRADTLEGNFQRIRNIIKDTDGNLFFCTSNGDDQIYKITR